MSLTFGSLFAGVGGFDQGLEAAGMECRWQVEWDASCQKLLKRKWPNAKHHGDITKVRAGQLERVDIVCGGSPCQNLSVAGLRAGLAGGQSRLFHDMVRICKHQRSRGGARYIIWENVDGAFSSCDGRDFAAVLRAFTGIAVEVPADGWGRAGFIKTPFPAWRWNCAWRLFDAQYFGVAQRRRRVFLVASAGDGSCAEILFEPESLRGDSAPSRSAGERITGTISSRTEGGGGLGTDFELGGGCAKSLKASDGGIDREDGHTLIPEVCGTLSASGEGAARTSGNHNQASKLIVRECAHSLCAHSAKGGDPTTDNYAVIAFMPARTLAKDGGVDERFAEREISDALHSSSGAGNKAPIIFHPTQDPIVSIGGPTPERVCGSANGQASVAVAIAHSLTANGFDASEDGTGRGTPLIPVENQQMGPCVLNRMAVRRLTPRECERLMGWPDDHTAGFSDSTRYKMCGNGVVRQCAEWIGNRIVGHLRSPQAKQPSL